MDHVLMISLLYMIEKVKLWLKSFLFFKIVFKYEASFMCW